jgi:hypothetical protein
MLQEARETSYVIVTRSSYINALSSGNKESDQTSQVINCNSVLLLLLQHLIQKQKSNLHFHNLKISNTEPAKYWRPSQKSDI